MSLSALMSRTVTIVKRSASSDVDDYGNEVPTETLVETECELQQFNRLEPVGQGEFSDTHWTGFFPAATDLNTGDAVRVGTEEYELEGDPWTVRNPRTGVDSHVECTLIRTAGAEDA